MGYFVKTVSLANHLEMGWREERREIWVVLMSMTEKVGLSPELGEAFPLCTLRAHKMEAVESLSANKSKLYNLANEQANIKMPVSQT